jgi:hypothetical protein
MSSNESSNGNGTRHAEWGTLSLGGNDTTPRNAVNVTDRERYECPECGRAFMTNEPRLSGVPVPGRCPVCLLDRLAVYLGAPTLEERDE